MATYGFWKVAQDDPDARGGDRAPPATASRRASCSASANRVVHGLRALGLRRGDTIAAMLDERGRDARALPRRARRRGSTSRRSTATSPRPRSRTSSTTATRRRSSPRRGRPTCAPRRSTASTSRARALRHGAPRGLRAATRSSRRGSPRRCPTERAAGASMTYTSGTTGRPKGVRRPARARVEPEAIAEPNAMFLRLFGITPHDDGRAPRRLAALPHGGAQLLHQPPALRAHRRARWTSGRPRARSTSSRATA